MPFYRFDGSSATNYPQLGITAQPGMIYQLAAIPTEPYTNQNPGPSTQAASQWTAVNGPASASAGEDVGEARGRLLVFPAGIVPGAAAGANAGSSPPAPVVTAGAGDTRGNITFGSGTGPAAGADVVVTFATAYKAAPQVFVTPKNTATQALGLYVSSVSTTGFTISSTNAMAASQANTIYSVDYLVIG